MIILKKLDSFVEKFSAAGLYASVFLMILFSVLTIVFRWVNLNANWFDPFVRHLVFLSTFFGGVMATGRKTHIGIDILGKFLETRNLHFLRKQVVRIIALASFGTLVWLIKASYDFMKIEFEFGKVEFLGIHSGYLVAIIPFGFSLIAFRFFVNFVESIFPSATKEGI